MREADVAVRLTPPRQADLIQRHLLTMHMHIYAAASYIKKMGLPSTPEELDEHRIIVYGHCSSVKRCSFVIKTCFAITFASFPKRLWNIVY